MPLQNFTRNVWLLCLAQVFAFTATNVTIFLGGIVGSLLAPTHTLATMPVAFMIVGTASGTVPASLIMSKKGRRFGFVSAAIFSSAAALLGAWAIDMANFWLYCLACFSIGLSVAFVQQYRFAAAESVLPEYAPTAISSILLAGIAGAFLGPNVANLTKDLLPNTPFVGSYMALALMVFAGVDSFMVVQYGSQTSRRFRRGPLLKSASHPTQLYPCHHGRDYWLRYHELPYDRHAYQYARDGWP